MERGMRQRIKRAITRFKKKGALSEETALPLKELGLPTMLKYIVNSPFGENLPFVQVGDSFYLSEEKLAKIGDFSKLSPQRALRPWIKHTSRVPRGYLRYQVLEMLRDGPLSGSEMTTRIEEETEGRWVPSPGSLYPLLKKLREDNIIEELPLEEGMKRYKLTELGELLFEDEMNVGARMRERFESGPFTIPLFIEMTEEIKPLRDEFREFFHISMDLSVELLENPDSDEVKNVVKILKSARSKLEKILDGLISK